MKQLALVALLVAVFWLIKRQMKEHVEDRAGARQNALNQTPYTVTA